MGIEKKRLGTEVEGSCGHGKERRAGVFSHRLVCRKRSVHSKFCGSLPFLFTSHLAKRTPTRNVMTTNNRFHSKDVQINEDLDFSSLVSNPALLQGLVQAGYQRPSPIQLKTIPLGRLGLDLIAQAKSGTGKTIVFSVIAIESVLSSRDTSESSSHQHQQPRAVILAPTREIAVQIQEVIQSVLHNGLERKVVCHSMIGGMPIQQDKANLQNCSIVVGTPGRIRSLISTGHLKPNQIRLLVLDEADKLMEDAFKDDVIKIAQGLGSSKQVMAFSATYDDDLLSQLDHLVRDPVYIMLSNGTPELEGNRS